MKPRLFEYPYCTHVLRERKSVKNRETLRFYTAYCSVQANMCTYVPAKSEGYVYIYIYLEYVYKYIYFHYLYIVCEEI